MACHNLGGFETERPNVAFSCYVGNELGQGGVVASHVRLVQTDGAISGPITQGLSSSDAYGAGKGLIVITGGQDDAAPIEAKAGFIALVQGVSGTGATSGLGGDLKGDIKATATSSGGWIESIISDGTVGQFQGTTPTISAATRNPSTDLHIAVLSAYECAANIPAGSASAPAMDVGDIEITHHFGRTSAFAIIGEFNQFSVGGNVRGEVYLNDGVPSDKTVQIGLTLYGNLRLPANGLEGQVIINQQNATGQWSGAGHIYLASTELVEEYSTLPSAIGGGAAGMAPFVLHEVASEPDQDGFVSNGEVDIEDPELACEKIDFTPEIELYGQVALSGDIDDRVNVEVWNGGAWTTAGFDLETTLVSNGTSRRLRLTYPAPVSSRVVTTASRRRPGRSLAPTCSGIPQPTSSTASRCSTAANS